MGLNIYQRLIIEKGGNPIQMSRTKNAARNIIFGIGLKVFQILIPFVMRTAMIYYMGVQYLGLNSLFTSILQVLNLAELGVGSAMVYSMYKPIAEDDGERICALMKLYRTYYRIIGLVVGIIGIIILPFIPKLIKSDLPEDVNVYILYLLHLSATVFSYWLFAYKNSLLQAHQRNDVISKVTFIFETIKYAIQLLILIFLKNYYIYILVVLLTQIITNIATAVVVDKMFPNYKPIGKLPKEEQKQINCRIRDLFTAKFGSVILSSADTIVISAFLGLTVLAIYQNYYFIMNSVYSIVCVIFSSVVAGIGNSLIKETIDKNYADLKKFTFIINWIICFCCCCFLCLYQPFVELWVGKDLMLSDFYVILFVIYFYVCVMAMVWATIKDAAGMWHEDRFRPLIGAGVNLIINIVLVNFIGLPGILLSTILSYVLISMPWLLHNVFHLIYKRSPKEYLLKLTEYMIITIVSCLCCTILCSLMNFTPLFQLIVNFVICVILSNGIQFVVFRKTPEFNDSKTMVLKLIHRG